MLRRRQGRRGQGPPERVAGREVLRRADTARPRVLSARHEDGRRDRHPTLTPRSPDMDDTTTTMKTSSINRLSRSSSGLRVYFNNEELIGRRFRWATADNKTVLLDQDEKIGAIVRRNANPKRPAVWSSST